MPWPFKVSGSRFAIACYHDQVHQDDLTGSNYPLVKEFLLELAPDQPSADDFQAL